MPEGTGCTLKQEGWGRGRWCSSATSGVVRSALKTHLDPPGNVHQQGGAAELAVDDGRRLAVQEQHCPCSIQGLQVCKGDEGGEVEGH